MKTIWILLLSALLLFLPLVACGGDNDNEKSEGKTYKLKMTHIAPETEIRGILAKRFAELVNERTNGRVEIEIYPNAMLYSAATEWDATVAGAVDMFFNITFFHIGSIPKFSIFYLNGMYESEEHIDRVARDAQIYGILNADLEAKGLHLLCLPHNQFWGHLFNSKHETKTWKSMSDLRYGTRPGSPKLHTDVWSGHTMVEVPQEEMFTAFSSGMIDQISVTASLAVSMRLWELGAKHGFETGAGMQAMMMVINLDTWNDLPADIQSIISDEVCPEIMDLSYDMMIDSHEANVATLKEHFKTWNRETPEEAAEMWAWAQDHPVVKGMKQQAGQELVERIESLRPSMD